MKSIYLAGGKVNNTAVNVMIKHLEGLGHRVTRDAQDPQGWDVTLRWGVSYKGKKPALNARVNEFDKYNGMIAMAKIGVPVPETVCANTDLGPVVFPPMKGPWLARKKHHVKGKDIVVCQTRKEVSDVYYAKTHDFFSIFIPTETEYRVWVINGKCIAVYEKQYKGEGEYKGYMRNQRFGFRFAKMDDLRKNAEITKPCITAVKSLNMEFGGVDLIKGKDGKYYVLEVNAMPAIEDVKRSSGIRLAKQVSLWAEEKR